MKSNSLAWWNANESNRHTLERNNQAAGVVLNGAFGVKAVYNPQDGTWYVDRIGGQKLYDLV